MAEKECVEVWLPLTTYSVAIRHRVLSELGELSHFVLASLSTYFLTLDELEKVTALHESQLQPVIDRLKGLRLISDDNELTDYGQVTAYILKHIHGKELFLTMDRHYSDKSVGDKFIILPLDSEWLGEVPPGAIEAPTPKYLKHNPVEDRYLQNQRLQNNLVDVLPAFLPEFKEISGKLGKRWWLEWDVVINRDHTESSRGICIEVPLTDYTAATADNNSLKIYTPAAVLNATFNKPEGVTWNTIHSPSPLSAVYSESDQTIYPDNYTVLDPGKDAYMGEPLSPDYLEEQSRALIDDINLRMETKHFNFSKVYTFHSAWQLHEYSYSEIIQHACPEIFWGN